MKIRNYISAHRKQSAFISLAILLIAAEIILNKDNNWLSLWTNFVCLNWYFLLLAISGMLLFSIQTIIPNKWFEPIKNQSLQTLKILKILLFSFLIVFATSHFFFERSNDSGFQHIWFSPLFLLLRAMGILLVWYFYANRFLSKATNWNENIRKRKSIELLLIILFTFSLFSWDWLMTIQAAYHSALFSFYLLISALLMAGGFLLVKNHQNKQIHSYSNDLGRLTLAFSLLWIYLFFSQFLIAWYTAIPDEIEFYHLIFQARFLPFLLISVLGNFILPFLILLRRRNRNSSRKLVWIGSIILITKWFEIYLLIAPYVLDSKFNIPLAEAGFIILGGLGMFYLLRKNAANNLSYN